MADDSILKKVLKNLGQIVTETGKEGAKEVGNITESIITGKELLGDIKPLSEQELAQKNAEDNKKIQQEINEIRRDVGGEIEQVRKEEEREEDEKEREFLERLKRQREEEERERRQLSSNLPGRKRRGAAPTGGKKKTQQPDPSQMSQTNEMAGGKID